MAIYDIVGPIVYTVVLITLGLLRPGCNRVTQSVREMAEAGSPNA